MNKKKAIRQLISDMAYLTDRCNRLSILIHDYQDLELDIIGKALQNFNYAYIAPLGERVRALEGRAKPKNPLTD